MNYYTVILYPWFGLSQPKLDLPGAFLPFKPGLSRLACGQRRGYNAGDGATGGLSVAAFRLTGPALVDVTVKGYGQDYISPAEAEAAEDAAEAAGPL